MRKRTLAILSALPPVVVDGLRVLLAGGTVLERPEEVFEIQRALSHGHGSAMLRKLDLARLLARHEPAKARERDLALALIASRVLDAGSVFGFTAGLRPHSPAS